MADGVSLVAVTLMSGRDRDTAWNGRKYTMEPESLDEQALQEDNPPEYRHPEGDELLALFNEWEEIPGV
jgi:hypothetical protein